MKLKNLTGLILVFILVLSLVPQSVFADSRKVIANLTSLSSIQATGFPASSQYRKTGSFSLKWSGADIYNNISIKTTSKDISGYGYLEVWVCSKVATGSVITLGLISDSAETACLDYYYTDFKVDFTGWKLFTFSYLEDSVFKPLNTPAGFNNITEIRLWSNYTGSLPDVKTELYFDNIYVTDTKNENASGGGMEAGMTVIADFSKAQNITPTGFPSSNEQFLSGDVTLKWAAPNLSSGMTLPMTITDWTPYKTLVMDIYSAAATMSTLKVVAMSQNDETQGDDYYMADLHIDWTGWRRVVLNIKGSPFGQSRTPIGWHSIQTLTFWGEYGGLSLSADTALYFDKIGLSINDNAVATDNTTDLIYAARPQEHHVDVVAKVREMHPDKSHPRLIYNKQDFENMKQLVVDDPYMKKTFANVLRAADVAVLQPVLTYGTPDGKRLPTTPSMFPPLAFAYKLTGEAKYKERIWAEIQAVAAFPDWNHIMHFLDTGDYSRYMGLAYDWLYDDWSELEKRTIRNAFVKHGIGASLNHLRNKSNFASQENNWNQVINAGIGIAMLAMCDEDGYEEMANEVINLTAESLPIGLNMFLPDGACPEGPSYWRYANETYYQYQNSMMTAMGFDFGLSEIQGYDNTGYYPISLMGPTNLVFNFADGGDGAIRQGIFFWLARLYNKPEFGGYQIHVNPNGGDWVDLAMYRPDPAQSDFAANMALDKIFRGEQPVASMRSSWYDSNALFVGFKGGYNQASHGDLDIGSFVLDAQGERWIKELGSEYYEADGMWDHGAGQGRWKYYRKNVEGQNTLIINPKATEAQDVYAHSEIYKFETSDGAAYGLVDMTDAYAAEATDVKRGFALINNRSSMLLQDEIKTKAPSEIYSFFHTNATLNIAPDGKSAIMVQGAHQMRVDLLSPANASLIELPASPFSNSPNPPTPNLDNFNTRKLTVHMTNAVNPTITVLFTPIKANHPMVILPSVIPLSSWDSYKEGSATLESLSIDTIPVEGFDKFNPFYTVSTGIVGKVSATVSGTAEIEIYQAEKVGDSAFIKVSDSKTGLEAIYTVSFEEKIPAEFTTMVSTHEIKSAIASDTPEPANVAENTFDKNMGTRWSAENSCNITWDMGEVHEVDTIMLSFMNGAVRAAIFNLEVSEDGVSYRKIFDGQSSGKTEEMERYIFTPQNVRYIRYNGSGTTAGSWNSITEMSVLKRIQEFSDIENHWSENDIKLLSSAGLINGVSETEFNPDSSITRAEFIAIAARILKLQEKGYAGEFSDVSEGDWYASVLSAAMSEKIIPAEMYPDGNIYPNKEITREEMTSIIVKSYEGYTGITARSLGLASFADTAEIADYAKSFVEKGLAMRVIQGMSETQFGPKNNATRAQAAVLAKRLWIKISE